MATIAVIYTRRSVKVLPTNHLDRPCYYEAVLAIGDKTEALLTADDCLELGEMLTTIGTMKEGS